LMASLIHRVRLFLDELSINLVFFQPMNVYTNNDSYLAVSVSGPLNMATWRCGER